MPLELTNIEMVIENEISQGMNQRCVAKTYAIALNSGRQLDWLRMNTAIQKRWPKGLERVKTIAHRLAVEMQKSEDLTMHP